MILTICLFTFSSLVSPVPDTEQCFKLTDKALPVIVAKCEAYNHDPLTTCEVQRVGATRYYVRIRTIEGVAPATAVKEQA